MKHDVFSLLHDPHLVFMCSLLPHKQQTVMHSLAADATPSSTILARVAGLLNQILGHFGRTKNTSFVIPCWFVTDVHNPKVKDIF